LALLLVAFGLRFASWSADFGEQSVSISRLVGTRRIPVDGIDRVGTAKTLRVFPPFRLPCVAVMSGTSVHRLPWTVCSSPQGSGRLERSDARRVVDAITGWGATNGVGVADTVEQLTGEDRFE
jgi:hypothetical protein